MKIRTLLFIATLLSVSLFSCSPPDETIYTEDGTNLVFSLDQGQTDGGYCEGVPCGQACPNGDTIPCPDDTSTITIEYFTELQINAILGTSPRFTSIKVYNNLEAVGILKDGSEVYWGYDKETGILTQKTALEFAPIKVDSDLLEGLRVCTSSNGGQFIELTSTGYWMQLSDGSRWPVMGSVHAAILCGAIILMD
tara:strand:- start:80694 stop:81278 length:585 start_codon:yes stop_codon:yes gene_type:complete